MPPHYNHTKASALCSQLRLLLVPKKGPATLKGLVKFSGSGPPGSLGLLELPKPRARPSLKKSICKGDGSYEDGDDESVLTHYPVSMSIFSSTMAPSHYGCFLTQKSLLLDPPGPGITPGWGIKVSKSSILIAWGVF